MMKKLIAVSAALVLMSSTAGCVGVTFSQGRSGSVEGKGDMVSVDFSCGDFSKLTIRLVGELYYTAEKSDKVTIELQENLVQYITVSTNNGSLVIDSEKEFNNLDKDKVPKIYVSAPMLEKLRVEGVVTIKKADKITADLFTLDLGGICNGALDLEVREMKADIAGIGDITLKGTADKIRIDTSGMGSVYAFGLQTKEADIETAGMGSIEVNCSDKLTVNVSGMGGVRYKGDPQITINEDGFGRVTKAE